jgi:hypothetical protein
VVFTGDAVEATVSSGSGVHDVANNPSATTNTGREALVALIGITGKSYHARLSCLMLTEMRSAVEDGG